MLSSFLPLMEISFSYSEWALADLGRTQDHSGDAGHDSSPWGNSTRRTVPTLISGTDNYTRGQCSGIDSLSLSRIAFHVPSH